MKLSDKIKELRIGKSLTQEELASKLHVSRQTVSKWEQEITTPSLETLKELALIFDVKLIELIGDEIKVSLEDKYKRRNRVLYLLNLFVVIMIILSALIFLRGMDDIIPAHYDFLGNITRYGKKIEYLVIPGMTLIFLAFSIYFYYVLSKKEEYKKAAFSYQISILILQLIIHFFTIYLGFKYTSDITKDIVSIITGLSFALIFGVMVFSHPRFNDKKNIIFGFRTNFTLKNDIAWRKVNTFASLCGSIICLSSYLITLITFKEWNFYLLILIIIGIIPPFIYHEALRKKFKSNI